MHGGCLEFIISSLLLQYELNLLPLFSITKWKYKESLQHHLLIVWELKGKVLSIAQGNPIVEPSLCNLLSCSALTHRSYYALLCASLTRTNVDA